MAQQARSVARNKYALPGHSEYAPSAANNHNPMAQQVLSSLFSVRSGTRSRGEGGEYQQQQQQRGSGYLLIFFSFREQTLKVVSTLIFRNPDSLSGKHEYDLLKKPFRIFGGSGKGA